MADIVITLCFLFSGIFLGGGIEAYKEIVYQIKSVFKKRKSLTAKKDIT